MKANVINEASNVLSLDMEKLVHATEINLTAGHVTDQAAKPGAESPKKAAKAVKAKTSKKG